MTPQRRRCKCLSCKELFVPDYRSGERQRFCGKPDCRKDSKRESQKAWLAQPENKHYFRDAKNAERVRDWQKEHPGYWKNTARYRRRTLQEACSAQPPAAQAPETSSSNRTLQRTLQEACSAQAPAAQTPETTSSSRTLQDLCSMQIPLFVGLISLLMDCTLPEDIATSTRRLLAKGHDILGMVPGMNLERLMHEKTYPQSGATPESSASVQLD